MTVQRIRCPSKGTCAKRKEIHSGTRIHDARFITAKHPEVRQEVMCQIDGLCVLMVGPPRKDGIRVGIRQLDQLLAKFMQCQFQCVAATTQPQANIGSNLVIAAAARVEFSSDCRSKAFTQELFHRRVDIFGIRRKLCCSSINVIT